MNKDLTRLVDAGRRASKCKGPLEESNGLLTQEVRPESNANPEAMKQQTQGASKPKRKYVRRNKHNKPRRPVAKAKVQIHVEEVETEEAMEEPESDNEDDNDDDFAKELKGEWAELAAALENSTELGAGQTQDAAKSHSKLQQAKRQAYLASQPLFTQSWD